MQKVDKISGFIWNNTAACTDRDATSWEIVKSNVIDLKARPKRTRCASFAASKFYANLHLTCLMNSRDLVTWINSFSARNASNHMALPSASGRVWMKLDRSWNGSENFTGFQTSAVTLLLRNSALYWRYTEAVSGGTPSRSWVLWVLEFPLEGHTPQHILLQMPHRVVSNFSFVVRCFPKSFQKL